MASSPNQHLMAALAGGLALSMSVATLAAPSAAAPPGSAAQGPSAAVMRKWTRSCALCHVDGTGGAPRLGDPEAWRPRLAQGMPTLLEHTVRGFNRMPPLGYCMSCEREDFAALIELMSGDPGGPSGAAP